MPNAAAPSRSWLAPALALVAAITAARVALLALSEADLYVDEAQYWLWGQDLAFGYFSKPPLVAWTIRAATELAGSDAPFWVRLPAPLLHGATALILAAVAARLHSARVAVVTAAAYATLPMVAVGSLLISTDTVMFPFLAGALALYLPLLQPARHARPGRAAAVGALLGLAFLAKYAALYPLALGALAALSPRYRPRAAEAAALLAAFALVAAPNLIWNAANGLATVSHTVDNTGWREGLMLDFPGFARFLAEQFAVAGPLIFLGVLAAALAATRRGGAERLLAILSLPILALVAAQALISGANANWAATAYLPGVILAAAWLVARRPWLWLSFAVNGALALALPIAATQAGSLRVGERLLLARYVGLDEFSQSLLTMAKAEGATAIVATERGILADLFYTGRGAGVAIHAWPHQGRPWNHYEQRHSYDGAAQGSVLTVRREGRGAPPPCAALAETTLEPGPGAYQGARFALALVPPDCWAGR